MTLHPRIARSSAMEQSDPFAQCFASMEVLRKCPAWLQQRPHLVDDDGRSVALTAGRRPHALDAELLPTQEQSTSSVGASNTKAFREGSVVPSNETKTSA